MTSRKLRMYQPVWIALKTHKSVTILAPPNLHKRIAQAVKKEKCYDLKFKEREGWRMMWLTYHSSGNELTFQLNYKLHEIMAKDL